MVLLWPRALQVQRKRQEPAWISSLRGATARVRIKNADKVPAHNYEEKGLQDNVTVIRFEITFLCHTFAVHHGVVRRSETQHNTALVGNTTKHARLDILCFLSGSFH